VVRDRHQAECLFAIHIYGAVLDVAIRPRKLTHSHIIHDEEVSLRRLSGDIVRRKAHHGSTLDSGFWCPRQQAWTRIFTKPSLDRTQLPICTKPANTLDSQQAFSTLNFLHPRTSPNKAVRSSLRSCILRTWWT
jgi:hypothetical protein